MNAVMSFALLSLLLVSGKVLRVYIPLFQRLYLPSFVIGGLWISTALVLIAHQAGRLVWIVSTGVIIFWLIFRRLLVKPALGVKS